MSDQTFNKTECEQAHEQCREQGFWLLRPRGLRKYFILEEVGDRNRYRLGKTWLDAKQIIGGYLRCQFPVTEPANSTTTGKPT